MDYPWYSLVEQENDIQQGDFIINCPVIIPPAALSIDDIPDVDVKKMDAVILTQSCDLVSKNIDNILVCRYFSLTDFFNEIQKNETLNAKRRKSLVANLKKGHLVSYHLLNKQEGIFEDYLIVDFKNVYGIHRTTLEEIIKNMDKRIRLLPPYREHLSQAFARYFMRVGLPQDIAIEGY
ncbi:hypothetical protein [Prolixibacter sp. SD074]|uniref:hypothetical protein n=1 Tax=Prolixibacter sp. SD074 TaxID=2652391 RepID=UPI00127CA68E|nr:hypothetical protein [Prolixibacter sp. SD074]GET29325.1 hypothetical protein SD074_15270 [Prolixibacter sp. SD074]